jgi:nitroimidazol reductase NimA-like FMN-containing flavoprotein (pyridoxamine 5'-phosphate oxidase superfamily)
VTKILSHKEAREVIDTGGLGRLGCLDQGGPYVVPINYIVDGDEIFSHSLPGKKIDAMRVYPRVCLQVDNICDDFHWRSALAFADFEEVTDLNQKTWVLRRLLERFPKLTPVESQLARDADPPPVIVFRLRIDHISGVAEE